MKQIRLAGVGAVLAVIAIAAPCAVASPNSYTTTRNARTYNPGAHPMTNTDRARFRAYHLRDIATTADTTTSAAVIVGGTPIMRFRNAAGGYSPEQRATETQERLNAILGLGPISRSDVTIDVVDGDAVVLVKGNLLFTADSATAAINDSTPLELAAIWADNMRQVLPGLTDAR